jgi:hypothetical protein
MMTDRPAVIVRALGRRWPSPEALFRELSAGLHKLALQAGALVLSEEPGRGVAPDPSLRDLLVSWAG